MASTFDIRGTSLDSFRIGKGGPTLNRSGSNINIGSDKIITSADLPISTILQTKTAEIGTQFLYSMPSSSSTSELLSVSITPISTSNKVLLRVNVNGLDIQGGSIFRVILRRDSLILVERKIECGISSSLEFVAYDFLDTPASTSAINYNIIIGSTVTSNLYVNKNSSAIEPQGYSSLTVMEIGPGSSGGGSSGEVNTASNIGTAGVGVFKQKNGVNLEFRNINAGSNKITITNDAANNEIDIDVNEANLSLSNIGGTLPALTAHASDTGNPHSVTAAQVGNSTAQWNANKLQGVDILTTAPTNGQILVYNSTTTKWEPSTPSSGGGGSSTLATLTDTTITTPSESQILTYNGTSGKWVNKVNSNSHPGYRSGLSYLFTDRLATTSTTTLSTGSLKYTLFYIAYPITISQFILNVSTVAATGSTFFAGIYSHNLSTALPNTLLVSGTAVADVLGNKTFTASISLKPGNYWFALSNDGSVGVSSTAASSSFIGTNFNFGSATVPIGSNTFGYTTSYTHAALPTTAPVTSLGNLSISPLYWFTIA